MRITDANRTRARVRPRLAERGTRSKLVKVKNDISRAKEGQIPAHFERTPTRRQSAHHSYYTHEPWNGQTYSGGTPGETTMMQPSEPHLSAESSRRRPRRARPRLRRETLWPSPTDRGIPLKGRPKAAAERTSRVRVISSSSVAGPRLLPSLWLMGGG